MCIRDRFYDVPTSAWYYTAVKYVYDNKLMDGVDTYVFAPGKVSPVIL